MIPKTVTDLMKNKDMDSDEVSDIYTLSMLTEGIELGQNEINSFVSLSAFNRKNTRDIELMLMVDSSITGVILGSSKAGAYKTSYPKAD